MDCCRTVSACRGLRLTLNLSTLISSEDDAVLFSSMWHTAVVSGVRASVLISAAVAALGPAWSQPGQVAPVTSHRAALSGNTQHTASQRIRVPAGLVTSPWPHGLLM